jgi:hypothetical protein
MTGHGFRGLASTLLHEQGWPHEHIELQLAHAPRNAVSAAYNHAIYLEPRAKMMQAWGDFLEQTQRGGKVVEWSSNENSPFFPAEGRFRYSRPLQQRARIVASSRRVKISPANPRPIVVQKPFPTAPRMSQP